MSASAEILRPDEISEAAEPLYFRSGDHQLFGWLHGLATCGASGFGMVICKPFGNEAICSHSTVRTLAEAAAGLGIPTLRFDYIGTGDSPDLELNSDQVTAWAADVVAAIEELKRRTGVERVVLLGIRLGALLALQTAQNSAAVTALVLLAPVLSGKRYLRELRTTNLASASGSANAGEIGAHGTQGGGGVGNADIVEAAGFAISAESTVTLSQIDWNSATAPPVERMLIIDDTGLALARRWAEKVCVGGAEKAYLTLPGLISSIMAPPHLVTVPEHVVKATREWLGQNISGQGSDVSTAPDRHVGASQVRTRTVGRSCKIALEISGPSSAACITERPVFFGPDSTLFGVVTQPHEGEKRHRAVVLLNAGGSYHVGPGSIYVQFAREWARCGYVVLRMDFAGLGDSDAYPGSQVNEIYPSHAIADARAAVELLRKSYAAMDISLVGLCSGAYHALRAAVAAVAVNRILMINPPYYFHDSGSAEDVQRAELVRDTHSYRGRVVSVDSWIKLFRGQMNWRFVAKTYLLRVTIALGFVAQRVVRALRVRSSRDLGRELRDVYSRGVSASFIFARGEPGVELLALQAGTPATKGRGVYRLHIIESGDHVFSGFRGRQQLMAILKSELFAFPGPMAAGKRLHALDPGR